MSNYASFQEVPATFSDHVTQVYDMNSKADTHLITRLDSDGNVTVLGDRNELSSSEPKYGNNPHPFNSARSNVMGSVAHQHMDAETLVTFNGQEAPMSTWEQLGFVVKDARGLYELSPLGLEQSGFTDQGQADNQGDQQQEEEHHDADYHPQELEDAFAKIIEPLDQGSYDSAMAKYAESLSLDAIDLDALAAQAGISKETATHQAKFIEAMFSAQVENALGAEAERVMTWAKDAKEADLKAAMKQLLTQRSLSGFKALKDAWAKDCSTPAQVAQAVRILKKQGIPVRQSSNGEWVYTDQRHGETSVQAGFNNGFLKWHQEKGK